MHLLHQQQKQNQLFCLLLIFVTQVVSVPMKYNVQNIRCNIFHKNCSIIQRNSPLNSTLSSVHFQAITNSRTSSVSTSRSRSTTKLNSVADFDAFSENLKRAALILAGIALGLGMLRICLMLCKSRSRSNSISDHHPSTIRPQIATIEHHQFKPDLPPAYAEAMANMENDGGKLPTYEELPYEQREERNVYTTTTTNNNNNGWISTQM